MAQQTRSLVLEKILLTAYVVVTYLSKINASPIANLELASILFKVDVVSKTMFIIEHIAFHVSKRGTLRDGRPLTQVA